MGTRRGNSGWERELYPGVFVLFFFSISHLRLVSWQDRQGGLHDGLGTRGEVAKGVYAWLVVVGFVISLTDTGSNQNENT
ncbi:hypothetical protein B0T19DRAFT_410474 [Cercophora scortea]|uniref:Uncharacterized protein n=1 Tax=Cercophora scortea TaxID=314031 RepID=A0AAE0J4I6_9PEZI|nr:hypothetical protein B0T19DRAFT_410474 [Cercophora scortea]